MIHIICSAFVQTYWVWKDVNRPWNWNQLCWSLLWDTLPYKHTKDFLRFRNYLFILLLSQFILSSEHVVILSGQFDVSQGHHCRSVGIIFDLVLSHCKYFFSGLILFLPSRWIKFEEKVEKGGERWSKPHVATLSLHSLFELRTCIEKGTIMLDMEASTLPQVVGKLAVGHQSTYTCNKVNCISQCVLGEKHYAIQIFMLSHNAGIALTLLCSKNCL